MNKHFIEMKRHYDAFQRFLLKKGQLPIKNTVKGYWGVSNMEEMFAAFCSLNLDTYEKFLDLGSGDGRIVSTAALFTHATGIEADEWLHSVALHMKNRLIQVPGMERTQLLNKDFMEHHLGSYDFIFINPDKPLYRGLQQKIETEMTGILLVIGHHFHPTTLQKIDDIQIGDSSGTLYKVPRSRIRG